MKVTNAYLAAVIGALSITAVAQTGSEAVHRNDSKIVGVWKATEDGVPSVTLNVTDESGSLQGAVVFYLLRREPGGQTTSTPGIPEPLVDLEFDGKTLTFVVSHRRAHPPESLTSTPMHFRMDLRSKGDAFLENATESGPTATLTKSDD